MAGLGSGLSKVGDVAQQYYENKRRRVMEDSQLETAALTRALAQAGEMRAGQKFPLELQGLTTDIDLNKSRMETEASNRETAALARANEIIQANQGTKVPLSPEIQSQLREHGLEGRLNPDGSVSMSPIVQSEMDYRNTQGKAAMIHAGADSRRARVDELESPSRIDENKARAEFERGTGRQTGGFGARGSTPGSQQVIKIASDMFKARKAQMTLDPIERLMMNSDKTGKARANWEAKQNALINDTYTQAKAIAEQQLGIKLTPQEDAEVVSELSREHMETKALEGALATDPNAMPGMNYGNPAGSGLLAPAAPGAGTIGGMPVFPVKR